MAGRNVIGNPSARAADPLERRGAGKERKEVRFDSFDIEYAITNPNGKDYARIDFFYRDKKVGQILFGSAIAPGSYADYQNHQISLYFPAGHYTSIVELLRNEKGAVLYVEFEPAPPGGTPRVMLGGLATQRRTKSKRAVR
jgi:hypothetical protein